MVGPLVGHPQVFFWEVYNEPCEWHHYEAGICTYFEVATSTMIKEQGYSWLKALQVSPRPAAPSCLCCRRDLAGCSPAPCSAASPGSR